MPRSGGKYGMPSLNTRYARIRMTTACQNGCRSFVTARSSLVCGQELDERLELRAVQHFAKILGHDARELRVTLGRVRSRVNDLRADLVCRATAAHMRQIRRNHLPLAVQLVAVETVVQLHHLLRIHRRAAGGGAS